MDPGITGLLALSGYPLVAIICGLIVLEELGVPMPFAPGDFLLVLAGVSIATAHVNPIVVVTATYVSALLGAAGCRELFARIGSAALPRIAAFLHVGDRVDDLTARLRRGGSTSVFLSRITPGLRVYTNEIAGLIGMRRRTFLVGLAPAIAVYEGVFIGLGVWLGPTAWETIEHYAPKASALLLLAVAIVGAALAGRAVVNRIRRPERRTPTTVMTAIVASSSSNSA